MPLWYWTDMRCRWLLVPCAALVLLAGPLGCKRKDPEKCDQGLKVTRQSAEVGDFALARQWREYAYKHCDDKTQLEGLDKEIVDKERQLGEKKAAEEAKQREVDALMNVFADWSGQNKAAPERATQPVCEGAEELEKKKERWCSGSRSVSGKYAINVRYWEGEPAAAQFSVRAPGEVTCDKLGPSGAPKALSGGARTYCDMTGGSLAGMKVLLTRTPEGVLVQAFSPQYLARDAGLKAIVGG